jgi:hypothetical protein
VLSDRLCAVPTFDCPVWGELGVEPPRSPRLAPFDPRGDHGTDSGQKTPPQTLRYLCRQHGREKRELLTNVLDPERLSAVEALGL